MNKTIKDETIECVKCMGTTKFFNGFGIKTCKLCTNGRISKDMARSYIDEILPYE